MLRLSTIGISTIALYIAYKMLKPTLTQIAPNIRGFISDKFQGFQHNSDSSSSDDVDDYDDDERVSHASSSGSWSQLSSDMYESARDLSLNPTQDQQMMYNQWRDITYLQYMDIRERLRVQTSESCRFRVPQTETEQLGYPWPRNDNWTDRELTMLHQLQGYEQNIDHLRHELREAYDQIM